MPGGSLGPVEQKFGADASSYLSEISKIIRANREVLDSIREIQRVRVDVDTTAAMAKIAALKAELGALGDKTVTVTVKYVTVGDKPGDGGLGAALGADHGEIVRHLQDISTYMDMATDSMGRMEEHLTSIRRDVADSSADLMMQTQILRDNADAHNLVATAAGRSAAATRDAAAVARDAATARYLDAMATRMAGGGGGGGGAAGMGTAAALNALFGGGGGGGGNLGAAWAALGNGGDPGTAATQFAAAAGFVRRWYPAFHWAMMLTNELLATVGPAVVAGGAAAAVGLQGGQQVANRIQSIYSVGESLGPSLGTTTGQFLGGGNALQQAQNLAGGGVYELLGGGINIAKTSASGAFAQLGLNTVAMLDRAMASIVKDFQGGMGDRLAGLVSGGTGYLQQFGDILGNIGGTFLNVAPNLPGVGGDLLSTLQGITGGLRATTGWLGSALGPILSFEAGSRWGPALVGGVGALGQALGQGAGNLGARLAALGSEASAARLLAGTGLEAEAGGGLAGILAKLGLGSAAEAGGLAAAGAGGLLARGGAFLGGLTAPQIGIIAAAVYTMAKGIGYQTPFQQQTAGILSGVSQSGVVAGIPGILSGMQQLAATPYTAPDTSEGGALRSIWGPFAHWGLSPGNDFHQLVKSLGAAWSEITTGTTGPTNFDVAAQGMQSLSDSMVNALGTGKQVQQVWKGLTGDTVSMSDAFNIATMAQLQLGSAFEKNGKLTAQAKTMIADLYAGYAPMVMNTGQFGAATGAVTAMQGLSKTQLSTVNSSLDQLVQIVSGGAAGTAAYAGLLQGLPAGTAQALTSFTAPASATSPGSAAAWAAFASTTQPSVVSQLQQQTDWLRTAQTLGALKPGQSTGMAAYLLGQALPSARQSPAAMAMLSTIAQEYGGPAIRPGESAAAMFHSLNHWVKTFGDTGKQFNRAMTTGTEKLSSIPQDAQQFVQTVQGGIVPGMAQGIATYGAGLQSAFMQSVTGKGYSPAALSAYVGFLKRSGTPEQGALDMAQYAAQLAGATKGEQAQIAKQVQIAFPVTVKLHADTSALQNVKVPDITYNVKGKAEKVVVPKPPDQSFQIRGHVLYPAIPKPPDQSFNIVGHVIIQGPSAASVIGGGGMRMVGGQSGFKVPGYGGGDTWGPAMLEPGELVVPKDMVAGGAVDHLRGRIPGFAGGGIVPGGNLFSSLMFWGELQQVLAGAFTPLTQAITSLDATLRGSPGAGLPRFGPLPGGGGTVPAGHPAAAHGGIGASVTSETVSGYGFAPGGGLPVPAAAQKVIDAFEKTLPKGIWGRFATQILDGLLDGIKNAPKETAAMARALVSRVQQEVSYGQQVAATAVSGLNLGGMQVATPTATAGGAPYQYYIDQQNLASGGAPLSVQQQMADYLQAEKSFGGDIGKLSRGHLAKGLMQQILAAGPIQGDALAQSILGGAGGTGAASKLWNQINAQANKLGIQGAEAVYGMPATHGKQVKVGVQTDAAAAQAQINAIHGKTVQVNVNLTISGGGGAGGGVQLSKSQISSITRQIQSSLLQQAKRNGKTGLQLQGYGS